MRTRFDRVNGLAQINKAQRYLEIGVNKGVTFQQVEIPFRVAVDPYFRFDTEPHANENTHFHQVTSDVFFSEIAPAYGTFDVIYLDGLHTFEQTFRDFLASLSYSHRRTIWLIDDTCPVNPASAEPSEESFRALKRQLNIASGAWMGDVYKVVCAIHDFLPQMSFATFPEHGQTAVWFSPRSKFSPKWNSLKSITELDYAGYQEVSDSILQRTPAKQIVDLIETAFAD